MIVTRWHCRTMGKWWSFKKALKPLNVHMDHGGVVGAFPGGSGVKEFNCGAGDAGDVGSVFGLGRSSERGIGHPLQYSCQGESHGQRSPAGYSSQGHKDSDMTEATWHACSMYLLWPCDSSSSHELEGNASKFPPNKNIGMLIVALFVAYSNHK